MISWVCIRIFFPQTSGDRMFFPDIQSYCIYCRYFLAIIFCAQNQTSGYFFLKSPIPPPPPKKSNGRPIISCIITAKRIRDRSLFIAGGSLKTLEGFRGETTQICLENEDMWWGVSRDREIRRDHSREVTFKGEIG